MSKTPHKLTPRRSAPTSQPWLHQHGTEIQKFDTVRQFPLGLSQEARLYSCRRLNQILADSEILYALYKKHHWLVRGATFYQLHLLLDKHAGEQLELIDKIAERVQTRLPTSWNSATMAPTTLSAPTSAVPARWRPGSLRSIWSTRLWFEPSTGHAIDVAVCRVRRTDGPGAHGAWSAPVRAGAARTLHPASPHRHGAAYALARPPARQRPDGSQRLLLRPARLGRAFTAASRSKAGAW